MRRLLVLALAVLLAVPVLAHADPVAGPTRVVGQAAADTAATCRRDLPLSDGQCASVPLAPPVSEAALAAYEKGWVHRALQLQYALGNGLPFRSAPWLGTHNSFNTTARMASLSGLDANQQLSMADQLRVDMRSLEVDVHRFPSATGGGYSPVVCHARGEDEGHAGCTTESTLPSALAEIAGWLRAHPGQVLLLYLEDHLETPDVYAQAATAVRSAFGSMLYAPGGSACTPLPLDRSRNDVLRAGKQVLIISGCHDGAGWNGAVFSGAARAKDETGPAGYGEDGSCDKARLPASYDGHLLRVFEDSTALSATVDQGSDPITAKKAAALQRCAVDITGFDQLLPDDGRLEASVWSWAKDEPAAKGDCAVQRADGRFHAVPCQGSKAFACQTSSGSWLLGRPRAYQAVASCPSGSTFAVPRYGYEAVRLAQAMAAAGVREAWLCYDRTDGGRFEPSCEH